MTCGVSKPVKGYLEMFFILDDGTKRNLINGIPGIVVERDWELNFELEKPREFKFNIQILEAFHEHSLFFGDKKNEIQIHRTKDGVTDVVYDGYVTRVVPTKSTNAGIYNFRVETIGSENAYFTDYVRGVTSFRDMKSKDILSTIGNYITKEHEHRFNKPDIDPNLNEVWLDDVQMDGQYSRLLDIIKERENAEYTFGEKGKLHFFIEEKLPFGDDITEKSFEGEVTIPSFTIQNEMAINSVAFKYKNIKGSIREEVITYKKGDTILVDSPVFEVKSLHVNNELYAKSKKTKEEENKTFSYSGRTISLNGNPDEGNVKVVYWTLEQGGTIFVDSEGKISEERKRRELSSPKFVQEISNDRITNKQDVIEYCKQYLKHRNKDQYTVKFEINDLRMAHTLVQDWIDLHQYNWRFNRMTQKYNHTSQNFDEIFTIDEDLKKQPFFPHNKRITQRMSTEACNDGKIPLEALKMEVTLETDQSNRWQNAYIRDKTQEDKEDGRTLNVALNYDWDVVSCETPGEENYTLDSLVTQTKPTDLKSEHPRDHLKLSHRYKTEVLPGDKNLDGLIQCKHGGTPYVRGYVHVERDLPKHHADGCNHIYRYAEGSGWQAAEALLSKEFPPNSGANDLTADVYTKDDNKWWHFDITINSSGDPVVYTAPTEMERKKLYIAVDYIPWLPGSMKEHPHAWDEKMEWGYSDWNEQGKRIDRWYFNPFDRMVNSDPKKLPTDHCASHVIPDFNTFPHWTITVDELDNKVTHYDDKWWISTSATPRRLFNDDCTVKKSHMVAVSKTSNELSNEYAANGIHHHDTMFDYRDLHIKFKDRDFSNYIL